MKTQKEHKHIKQTSKIIMPILTLVYTVDTI